MKTFLLLLLMLVYFFGNGQPVGMNYQSVVRSADGQLVQNQPIGVQVSILKGDELGITVFQERHFISTNINGLCGVEIGSGTLISGDLGDIDWGSDGYWIKTEIDLRGGSSYTQQTTVKILSVPYSFYAAKAGAIDGIDMGDYALRSDLFNRQFAMLLGVPNFALTEDLFSGNYNDLSGRPLYLSYFENDEHYVKTEELDYFSGLYGDLSGVPTVLSTFINDVGFIINETDGSVTNELQDLQIVNDVLILSGSSEFIDLSGYDQSAEIQALQDRVEELEELIQTLLEDE